MQRASILVRLAVLAAALVPAGTFGATYAVSCGSATVQVTYAYLDGGGVEIRTSGSQMESRVADTVANIRRRLGVCGTLRWFGGSFASGSLPLLVMHWRGTPCIDLAMSLQGAFASLELREDWVLEV
jgi:hypothetical protein